MNTIRKPTPMDVMRLLAVSAMWSSSFICIAIALRDFSPVAIAGWRVVIAAVVVLLICHWQGMVFPRDKRTWMLFAVIGLFNSAIPFSLIGWGQAQGVNSSTTALLIAGSPFATLLMSHFMTTDDRFTWYKLVGLIFGFTGVVVILGSEVSGGNSITSMLGILAASFCYAFSTLMIRKVVGVSSLVIVAGALITSSIVLLPLVLIFYPPTQQVVSADTLLAVVYMAIVPTALAYFLRTTITQTNGATFLANAGYLIPFFAVIWGWLFLSETPQLNLLLALLLISIGIWVGQKR